MSLINRARLLKPTTTSSILQLHSRSNLNLTRTRHSLRFNSTSSTSTPTATPIPTPIPIQRKSFLQRHPTLKYTVYGFSSIVFSIFAITAGILAHDALTYREAHIGNIPATPLALHPKPGGPKNLPIVSDSLQDEECEESKGDSKKERLVIVGGGWAGELRTRMDLNV